MNDDDNEMTKLGVDEGLDEELEKRAAQGCPKCGKTPKRVGKLLVCDDCGSEPFERVK